MVEMETARVFVLPHDSKAAKTWQQHADELRERVLASVREMVGRLADLRVAMTSDEAIPNEHDDTDIGPAGTLIQPAPQILQRMAEGAEASGSLESSLKALASKVAGEQSKQVQIVCSGLDNVPKNYRKAIKDITIQMVRNCVSHGIETPAERSNAIQ